MELKIKKETAKKIYSEVPDYLKEILVETFGIDCFKKKDWKDIKTFEDACEVLNITNDSCRPIFDEEEDPDEIAYKKLKVIVKAINQGWIPDWDNSNQYKYWPWFNLSSGFGFSLTDCRYALTLTYVGSRLCFESREKSDYTANQFLDLYKEFLTITK
jgi:hypothetical protein